MHNARLTSFVLITLVKTESDCFKEHKVVLEPQGS